MKAEMVHQMFVRLYEKDEAKAIAFIDQKVKGKLKLALRDYWAKNNYDKFLSMFFNK